MILLPLLARLALAAPPQQDLLFQVAAPSGLAFQEIQVHFTREGEEVAVPLVDDGSVASDLPWDGVYVGRHRGTFVRWLPVRIEARWQGGAMTTLYAGVEKTDSPDLVSLGWQVRGSDTDALQAHRAAAGWPSNRMIATEGLFLVGGIGWTLVVLTWVGFLVVDRRRDGAREGGP